MDLENKQLYRQVYNLIIKFRIMFRNMPMPHPELTNIEFNILCVIDDYTKSHPDEVGPKPSELSRITGMSRPAVSQQLKTMEEKDLIRRVSSTEDRRVVYLVITEKSQKIYDDMMADKLRTTQEILRTIGSEKCQSLIEISEEVMQIFQNRGLASAAPLRQEERVVATK